MQDLMWIALTIAFFAVGLYYASGCDRLWAPGSWCSAAWLRLA